MGEEGKVKEDLIYFKVFFPDLPGRTEKKHEKSQLYNTRRL
jgi:hypothetical protein